MNVPAYNAGDEEKEYDEVERTSRGLKLKLYICLSTMIKPRNMYILLMYKQSN
jgi:hypothetical protein